MTRLLLMINIMNPMITSEMLAFLKQICDVPARASDTNEVLRWKCAQREVYLKAKELHERAMSKDNKASTKAESLGIQTRSED